jgi:hypothetical protein
MLSLLLLMMAGAAAASDSPAATASQQADTTKVDVGAIYFGDWAPDPWMESIHGTNWTEWSLPLNAQPRYPGHHQPNLPINAKGWGPEHPESDPANMAVKIDAAADHAIDFFMFDWYWYAETGVAPRNQGPQGFAKTAAGGPFLEAALNAFVAAPNSKRLKFCLHFCTQDWVDVHPAKRGYHSTGRPYDAELAGGDVAPPRVVDELLMFDGWMTLQARLGGVVAGRCFLVRSADSRVLTIFLAWAQAYRAAFDHVASKFFTLEHYLTVPTKQTDGSVKDCVLFAIYQLSNMESSLGETGTIEAFQHLRNASQAHAGKCVHIQLMSLQPSQYPLLPKLGVDSHTDYCWFKLAGMASVFPETPYDSILNKISATWDERESDLKGRGVSRYVPSVSTAWDSSPRTLIHEPYEDYGYPWGPAFHAEPAQFGQALELAKAWAEKRCSEAEGCPPILINAWNEWSEGAYLEPDQRYGFGKLQAINMTFST